MKRLSNDEISTLFRELAYLIHAGLSHADALAMMAEEADQNKPLLKQMADAMDEGESLSSVFASSGLFPEYASRLLLVGERSGRIEETLNALADNYAGQERLNRQLRTSLLYPAILLLIMLVVIVVLLVYVLPIFERVYAQFGVTMTGVAGSLLSFGRFMSSIMPVLCGILCAAVLACLALAVSQKARSFLLSYWRRNRGDKGVSRQINDARFAMALSMGLRSGMPVEEALLLAGQVLEDVPAAKDRVSRCIRSVEDGSPLAKSLEEADLMPKTECQLLAAGLRSGVGDLAVEQITARMNERSELSISEKVSRVEPTLVIITSLLVGMILLSVMLPLMNIMATIG